MTDENIKQFKSELRQLLEKYNASIHFTCSDSSDTHGLHNDHIVIVDNKNEEFIVEADGWWLKPSDLQ